MPAKKYASQAEQKRAWRARKKAEGQSTKTAGKAAKGWVNSLAAAVNPSAPPVPSGDEPGELPGLDLPIEGAAPASEEAAKPEGEAKTETKSEDQKAEAKPDGEPEKVDNKEIIAGLAGAYASALKKASEYANKHNHPGLPDKLIAMNYSAMKLILEKQLKDAEIDQEEYAAYLCVGSSSWLGFWCYRSYKDDHPSPKTNDPTTKVKPDAGSVASPHVNGTNGTVSRESAQNLVVRSVAQQSGQARPTGGVYK